MATETVLIDFQIDYTELTNAQAELAKTGKIDTKGFDAIQAAIDTTATDTKGLIKTFKDVAGASIKMGKTVEDAFGAGIQDALDEAGVSVEEFGAALKKANAPATTLKKELAQLKESMARMKAEGKDTGKEFDSLRQRAGKLSDAIADANNEIKNAGSDTRGIDNVVGSISALAGGYSAVQGAAALFGDESEDLQKALLKVNGAMALASGVQQFYNATLKEGSLTRLADSIATGAQTAATTLLTFVTTGATVAARAYRVALLATGIGAVVVLVLALVSALQSQKDTLEAVNKEIDYNNTLLESNNRLIAKQAKLKEEIAKAEGASESKLMRIRAQSLVDQYNGITQENKLLASKRDALKSTSLEYGAYNTQIEKNKDLQAEIYDELQILNIQGTAQVKKENAERLKAIKDFNDKKNEGIIKAEKETAAELKRIADEEADYHNHLVRIKKAINDDLHEKQLASLHNFRMKQKAMYEKMLADFKKMRDDEKEADDQYYIDKWENIDKDEAKQKAIDDAELARKVRNANISIALAEQVNSLYSSISNAKTERDNQEIASERKLLEERLKAGAITQKQADVLSKRIDEKEKKARYEAAKREKQAALFQAVLAIPKAFLQGLTSAPPPYGAILGAIAAALAAAQAAVIASKPIPKFFRGKKDKYAGPGVVGDMGSELVERDGRMYLYTKPTQTYLGANDKVYTASETRNIMHNTNVNTTVRQAPQEKFDYNRLAKSIPVSTQVVNIDKDFISESVANGLSRVNYMDRRYSSRK